MRLGRVLLKVAHLAKLFQLTLNVSENVLGLPGRAFPFRDLEIAVGARADHEGPASVVLNEICHKPQRSGGDIAATDVCQIFVRPETDNDGRVVELRPKAALAITYACRNETGGVAQGDQQFVEQAVEFIAESAAAVLNDLCVEE